MVLRGILYARTWRPPILYTNSTEELRAELEIRSKRNERLYILGRYAVVAVLILIFVYCVGTLINYYINFSYYESRGEFNSSVILYDYANDVEFVESQNQPKLKARRSKMNSDEDHEPTFNSPKIPRKIQNDINYSPLVDVSNSTNFSNNLTGTTSPNPHFNLEQNGTQNELDEVALSIDLHELKENKIDDYYNGYVLLRVRNEWHPYCFNEWSKELSQAICREILYYKKLVDMKLFGLDEINQIRMSSQGNVTTIVPEEEEEDENFNLLIIQKDPDIYGNVKYKKDEQFEQCYVAFITCSNL